MLLERRLERLRPSPGTPPTMLGGHADLVVAAVDRLDRLAQRDARSEVERDGDDRELPLVVQGERRGPLLRRG